MTSIVGTDNINQLKEGHVMNKAPTFGNQKYKTETEEKPQEKT